MMMNIMMMMMMVYYARLGRLEGSDYLVLGSGG